MAQRADLSFVNNAVVAEQAYACCARNRPVENHTAGNDASLRDLERRAHLGAALEDFLKLRIEQPRHGQLDLVDQVVDDGVEADIDALFFRQFAGGTLRANVESDHNGVRGRGQEHIVRRDRADRGVDDADLHFGSGHLAHRVGENFHRALYVGLEDEVELLRSPLLHALEELIERHA